MAFPNDIFDTYKTLYGTLGSFWQYDFDETGKTKALMASYSECARQDLQNQDELVKLLGVLSAPTYHTIRWWSMTVKSSDAATGPAGGLRYAPNYALYGGGVDEPTYVYGGPGAPNDRIRYAIPDDLVRCVGFISNKLKNPDIIWINDVDFTIDSANNVVTLFNDPFDGSFDVRPVFDENGAKIDEELTLWFWNTEWDKDYLFNHFGYILNINAGSSDYYSTMVRSFWQMLIGVPTKALLSAYLSGITGVASVIDSQEVVEVILTYPDKYQVVTDTHVYTAPSGANVLVAVGDTVYAGDSVFDSYEIIDLSGSEDGLSGIDSLSFGETFISGEYTGELTFENDDTVTLDWGGYDDDGRAVVTFEIHGYGDDVTTFWDSVHANGKLLGSTLAELLDTRTVKVGQPNASNLPATINPLEFIVNNYFKNNVYILKMNMSGFAENAPGLTHITPILRVTPPQKTFIILVYFTTDGDTLGGFTETGPTYFQVPEGQGSSSSSSSSP